MPEFYRPGDGPREEAPKPDLTRPETSAELDLSRYPERISGYALPELEEGRVEVEVIDSVNDRLHLTVPAAAVTRLNMPRLRPDLPDEVKQPIEAGIGLAMVACRLEEHQEELVRVAIPTAQGGEDIIIAPTSRMVRRHGA